MKQTIDEVKVLIKIYVKDLNILDELVFNIFCSNLNEGFKPALEYLYGKIPAENYTRVCYYIMCTGMSISAIRSYLF